MRQENKKALGSQEIRTLKKDIEEKYLDKIIIQVEAQNKEYFEEKARELLRIQEKDLFAKSSANLLFLNSPRINRQELEAQVKNECKQSELKPEVNQIVPKSIENPKREEPEIAIDLVSISSTSKVIVDSDRN